MDFTGGIMFLATNRNLFICSAVLIGTWLSARGQVLERTALSTRQGEEIRIVRSDCGMVTVLSPLRAVLYDIGSLQAVHENIADASAAGFLPSCASVSDDGRYVAFGEDGSRIFIESIPEQRVVDTVSIAPRRWNQVGIHLFSRDDLLVLCDDLSLSRQVLLRLVGGTVRYRALVNEAHIDFMEAKSGIVGLVDRFNGVQFARVPDTDSLIQISMLDYSRDPSISHLAILDSVHAILQFGHERTDLIDIRTGAVLSSVPSVSFSYDHGTGELYTIENNNVVLRDRLMNVVRRMPVGWMNAVEIFANASGVAFMLDDGTIVGRKGRVRNLRFDTVKDFQERDERSIVLSEYEACYIETELIVRYRVAARAAVALGNSGYAYSTNDTVHWYLHPNQKIKAQTFPETIAAMTIVEDTLLYAATCNGTLYSLSANSGVPERLGSTGNANCALRLDLDTHRSYAILSYKDGCDLYDFATRATNHGHGRYTFLRTPGLYASLVSDGSSCTVLDLATRKMVSRVNTPFSTPFAAVSGSGEFIALYTRDSSIVIFDIHNGTKLYDERRSLFPAAFWSGASDLYVLSLHRVLHAFSRTGETGIDAVPVPGLCVFPNPSSGVFYLKDMSPDMEIRVFDALGRLVREGREGLGRIEIMNSGVYFIAFRRPFERYWSMTRVVVQQDAD